MAVCLDYQAVYAKREEVVSSLQWKFLLGAVIALMLAARIWVKIECVQVGYDIGREQHRAVELDMKRRELELARTQLLRRDRLEREARKLGLVPLDPSQAKRMVVS